MWYKSYHINLYVKWCQYSICIRSTKPKTNTEISFSFLLTLFYSIPSLSPYRQTDRRTDRQTEERIYPGCEMLFPTRTKNWHNSRTGKKVLQPMHSECICSSVCHSVSEGQDSRVKSINRTKLLSRQTKKLTQLYCTLSTYMNLY